MKFDKEKFINISNSLVGTKYVLHSYCPRIGLDCATFVHYCLLGAGFDDAIDIPLLNPDFGLHVNNSVYVDTLNDYFTPVKQPLKGDLILVKYGRSYSHIGIVLDSNTYIHCALSKGVVISKIPSNKDQLFFRVG